MEVTPGDTKGSPRGSPGACYHQEILLVTVPVLLVFLSLHDVHASEERTSLITGDFNICYQMNQSNRLIQGLDQRGFSQLVNEATHIQGRHIDHVYWRDRTCTWSEPDVERYSPYYSDHDAICVTIKKISDT